MSSPVRSLLLLAATLPVVLSCTHSTLSPHALPPAVHVTSRGAGRWAMFLETDTHGGCSMSSFDSSSRASIVLELAEEGAARGCRGRRWVSTVTSNEGDPHPDTTELMEQQGMRGTWTTRGDGLRIELGLDDSVCAPMRNAKSENAIPWTLDCVALAPNPGPVPKDVEPPFAALVCHLVGLDDGRGLGGYPHDVGYTASLGFEFFGRDTIFLGEGHGARIVEHAYGGLFPEGMRTWTKATTDIGFGAWSESGPKDVY
jgi:hypothetical protein